VTLISPRRGDDPGPLPPGRPGYAGLRYSDVAEAMDEGLLIMDRQGRVLESNENLRAIVGSTQERLASVQVDMPYWEVVDEHGAPLAVADYPFTLAVTEGKATRGMVLGITVPGGTRRWVRMNVIPMSPPEGEDVIVITAIDVTKERAGIAALAAAEHRYRLASENAPIGIAIVDPDGTLIDSNEALCRLLGYRREDLVGKTFHEITHPDDLAVDIAHVHELLEGSADTYRIEKRYLTQEGRVIWAQLSVALARDEHGKPLYFISMIEDISSQREAHLALAHRATHDELTGLPNRTLLLDRAQQALAQSQRDGTSVALLFCDLDHFKLVNDSRGHQIGDAVLIETARRFAGNIRGGDTAARLGGDEFVVLCPQLGSPHEVERVAQRLIDMLTEPMSGAPGGVTMTVSVGIAFSGPGVTAHELLRNADAAMYKAKTSGRDRFALFSPDLISQATERLDMERELRDAIRTEALYLDYQPVCRLADGHVIGYESLVRWRHPQRGVLNPAVFLPFAESSDLVLEIDRWVLEEACRTATGWGNGPDAPDLTVNISARHIGRGLLPGLVAHVLRESGLRPQRLLLEITETALLGMTPTAASELDTLVHLGVSLAIDDFGTGYSSLAHLVDVPATYAKIDRSFVSEMTRSPARRAIVAAVISLCQALNITVIAEGIEEEGQRDLLRSMGCNFGQGYLLGRPGSKLR
jgi:diguanylate cyclase (GGDEF)-like protein/PAS domain S-box-containing protein